MLVNKKQGLWGARREYVRQESSEVSPLAPFFKTSALAVVEAATSFSVEEVKSSVYLTTKIPGIPPGPSLNIPKRLDYSPQSELLSLNAKATAPFFKPGAEGFAGSHSGEGRIWPQTL